MLGSVSMLVCEGCNLLVSTDFGLYIDIVLNKELRPAVGCR